MSKEQRYLLLAGVEYQENNRTVTLHGHDLVTNQHAHFTFDLVMLGMNAEKERELVEIVEGGKRGKYRGLRGGPVEYLVDTQQLVNNPYSGAFRRMRREDLQELRARLLIRDIPDYGFTYVECIQDIQFYRYSDPVKRVDCDIRAKCPVTGINKIFGGTERVYAGSVEMAEFQAYLYAHNQFTNWITDRIENHEHATITSYHIEDSIQPEFNHRRTNFAFGAAAIQP